MKLALAMLLLACGPVASTASRCHRPHYTADGVPQDPTVCPGAK